MAKDDTKRYSLKELDQLAKRGDVVPTPHDAPEIELNEDFWRNAQVIMPDEEGKTPISLRVDNKVLKWFRQEAKRGYLTRMNAVLRAYVETQQHHS